MKRLFTIIMILVLSFISVFAYNSTIKDEKLLDAVYERVDTIEDKSRLERIAEKINSVKGKFKSRARIYYILDSIQSYIEASLDDEMADVIDGIFGDDDSDDNSEDDDSDDDSEEDDSDDNSDDDDSDSDSSDNNIANNPKNCSPLADPTWETITVSTMTELRNAVNTANAKGDTTILIEDGTYYLDNMLYVTADNITFRGKSGDREKVILKWKGMNGWIMHVFLVRASDFTVADLTLGWIANHGIQIQWEHNADRPLIHNVHILDTGEQMIKGSYSKDNNIYSDDGVVECSLMEYSVGIGPQYYIWWIDIHRGMNWVVQDNTFRGIRSPESRWAEYAVHFWSNSSGTIVQRNRIINCDRGIGFGLGGSPHTGWIIRNNLIYHNTSKWDVGIGLESASGVKVYNNTLYQEHSYANAIEYRFEATNNIKIINNLTNKNISSRNGGAASLENNITNATSSWFQNVNQYDFELTSSGGAAKWQAKELDEVEYNINGEEREDGWNIGAF